MFRNLTFVKESSLISLSHSAHEMLNINQPIFEDIRGAGLRFNSFYTDDF